MFLFSKFSDCIDDLLKLKEKIQVESTKVFLTTAAALLDQCHKFYLPDGGSILAGVEVDQQTTDLIHLPFKETAVLSTWELNEMPLWRISMAFDVTSENKIVKEVIKQSIKLHPSLIETFKVGRTFLLLSISQTDRKFKNGGWFPVPYGFSFIRFSGDEPGYDIQFMAMKTGATTGIDDDLRNAFKSESHHSVGPILDLCVMLSMKNISSETIHPPKNLLKKRIKKGKTALPEYKVLKINGKKFDKPIIAENSNTKRNNWKRSHFRRGHIRILKSNKAVPVRSTIVKGRRAGFLKKDYEVSID